MRAADFITESMIKIGAPSQRATAWIEKVYRLYPGTFQNNHVMVWGEGEDQQFAMFELVPSMSKRDAVEVKWFQAYPLRQGVGSRAMQELQRLAREDGIALTLYPWDKGQVSQAKLMKFYRRHGFKPTARGAKNMSWEPNLDEMAGSIHGGIRTQLQQKGYKYLGGGVDKQAWLEPDTGYAYIVVGTRNNFDSFTPDQRMFVDWVNYCNANKNNPNLPKFSGLESFQFHGQTYLQCRMEKLEELGGWSKEFVFFLLHVVKKVGLTDVDAALTEFVRIINWMFDRHKFTLDSILKEMNIDQTQLLNLLKTVEQVMAFGKEHGFELDLHTSNYMRRPDGTIVVNDPFVLWLD